MLNKLVMKNNIREYTYEFNKLTNIITDMTNIEKRRRYILGLRG